MDSLFAPGSLLRHWSAATYLVAWFYTYLLHSTLLGAAALWLSQKRLRSFSMRRSWQLTALLLPTFTAGGTLLWSVANASEPAMSLRAETVGYHLMGSERVTLAQLLDFTASSSLTRPGWLLLVSGSVLYWVGCGLVLLWLAVALRRLSATATAARRLKGSLAHRRDVGGHLDDLVGALARTAGVSRRLRVTQTPSLASPTVVGPGEICLPTALVDCFPVDELRAVLAHEVAHIQHRDWLWYPLLAWLEAALCVQPLNLSLGRLFRHDAELAADDRAVVLTRQPESLARALLRVAEHAPARSAVALVPAMSASGTGVVARVSRLLEPASTPHSVAVRLAATPLFVSLPLLWLGVAADHAAASRSAPEQTMTATEAAQVEDEASNEQVALAKKRHTLDVELQELLWEGGVPEDDGRVQQLRAEIARLDALADALPIE